VAVQIFSEWQQKPAIDSQAGTWKVEEPARPWPRRILLASDGSAHSTKAANVLAAMVPSGALVRVITVASLEFASYEGEWGPLSDQHDRKTRLQRIIENAFAKPLEHLEGTDCQIEKVTRLGNPSEQIMNEIYEWHPDLVVVGRLGAGGLAKLLLGSVSEHLVKHAQVPVLVVP
jgi:nucleotide-binding universal stress UspA family protein